MSEEFEFEPVIARLRQVGRQPVDPAVATAHLAMLAAVPPRGSSWWRRPRTAAGKVRVGVAVALAGSLAGTTGLAFAGALPNPAQQVAHDALQVVGVSVPAGTTTEHPPCDPSAGSACAPGSTGSATSAKPTASLRIDPVAPAV